MLLGHQRVAGHAAPGRKIGRRARIERPELQDLTGRHLVQAQAKLEHQLAAAELASVPLEVGRALMVDDGALALSRA
jgi:hypothetical protein